jgi:hypothetical protein
MMNHKKLGEYEAQLDDARNSLTKNLFARVRELEALLAEYECLEGEAAAGRAQFIDDLTEELKAELEGMPRHSNCSVTRQTIRRILEANVPKELRFPKIAAKS